MGEAFKDGQRLGDAVGDTRREVLEALERAHPEADEIRIRTRALDEAVAGQMSAPIEVRISMGIGRMFTTRVEMPRHFFNLPTEEITRFLKPAIVRTLEQLRIDQQQHGEPWGVKESQERQAARVSVLEGHVERLVAASLAAWDVLGMRNAVTATQTLADEIKRQLVAKEERILELQSEIRTRREVLDR